MTSSAPLLAALAAPLVLAGACLFAPLRRRALLTLPFAPVPALVVALAALIEGQGPADSAFPAERLALDAAGAILLFACALLWLIAGCYAAIAQRGGPAQPRFALSWLLTLAGSVGVFMAGDLLTFYLVFALVSVPALGLILHDEDGAARRAGGVYLAFTILGETVLLLGFALLAAGEPRGSLAIADVMAALPHSRFAAPAIALTIAGFAMKMAIAPMHGFMPLAYAAAPAGAAAVLSGAAVKAGLIGLIRFIPFEHGLPGLSEAMTAAGLFSAFYGVAIGVTQTNPKTVLAYSSISQMGVLATVVGMGLSAGDRDAALQGAFYGANHALIKGALFLAIGVAALGAGRSRVRLLVIAPALALALSLGGLPLTGGALAKLAVKDTLGNYVVGWLAAFSAAGTTLLMLHFVGRVAALAPADPAARAPAGLLASWLAAAAAALVIPFALYPSLGLPLADALNPYVLFEGSWPILIGAGLALALRRWGARLPAFAPGDILGAEEAGLRALEPLAELMRRGEAAMRRWPAAALSLVAIAALVSAALAAR